jgi:hypothetical protein
MLFARRGGVLSARPLCYSLPTTHPQTRFDGRGEVAYGTEEKAGLLCETLRERPANFHSGDLHARLLFLGLFTKVPTG